MSLCIEYAVDDGLALIGLANKPVNALNQNLRASILDSFERAAVDTNVKGIVLYGNNGVFCAGADITEFGTEKTQASPDLSGLLIRLSLIEKPVIAAISGYALGGGLELALICDYRIAEPKARLGLPEINLGLLPGAGGTQRLPRLIGVESSLDMMISGKPISAKDAIDIGLLDRLAADGESLLEEACAFARSIIVAQNAAQSAKRRSNMNDRVDTGYFANFRKLNEPVWKSRLAPQLVLRAVEASCSLSLEDGLDLESALFKEAEASNQSKALRHVFFAERDAGKVPGVSAQTPLRPIEKVAVIGAGTMGGGIAMNFANAGIPVILLELQTEALQRGLTQIRKNYEISVKRGKLSADQLERRMALVTGTVDYSDLSNVDLVIEAVFENLAIKQNVFRKLDEVCRPGAILASNTSTLDVDAIANVTNRPNDVIGLHFFSPANVMRLLEVVRADKTSPTTLSTTLKLAKRIDKMPVLSGVCFGFIGNRMFEPYSRETHRLLLEGATPSQIDKVLTNFGMAMGMLAVQDLAGIDVGYLIRESRRSLIAHDPSYCILGDELYKLGRYGQKTSAGFYRYEGRDRLDDAVVDTLAQKLASDLKIVRRRISDDEIRERCLFGLINEGIQLLDEGIALRASDIDLVYINGYGFPAYLGGPMHYAETIGLSTLFSRLQHYRESLGPYGEMWFQPPPLLEQLVKHGRSRIEKI